LVFQHRVNENVPSLGLHGVEWALQAISFLQAPNDPINGAFNQTITRRSGNIDRLGLALEAGQPKFGLLSTTCWPQEVFTSRDCQAGVELRA